MLDLLDADLAGVYRDLGLDWFRPRFTPVVRVLAQRGPCSVRELADALRVTHSAASQTVARMRADGLVTQEAGADARRRIVHLTARSRAVLPLLEAEWAATEAAAAELESELPHPLSEVLDAMEHALADRPLRDRIADHAGDTLPGVSPTD